MTRQKGLRDEIALLLTGRRLLLKGTGKQWLPNQRTGRLSERSVFSLVEQVERIVLLSESLIEMHTIFHAQTRLDSVDE